jgi:DNA helicase-2/ATP-dependent DNA helicase PcrA
MDDLAEGADSLGATQFLKLVLDRSDYLQALKQEGTFEAQARAENLEELLNAVAEWEEETGGGPIGEFLDEASLMASVDDRAVKAVNDGLPPESVTLMTLHNAKGLEFPVVFLVGLEENLIPHRSSTASMQEIEEERRLLYVGITRAREELFLVHCESRMLFGRTESARPSRFLEDSPSPLLTEIDVLGQEMSDVTRLSRFGRSTWQGAVVTAPAAAAAAPGTAPAAVAKVVYRGGERVSHPRFGSGTIVGVSGEGGKVELTVVFDDAGPKRLIAKYANLSPA